MRAPSAAKLAAQDAALLEAVQRQTFRFFWEGAHPVSGLALDRRTIATSRGDDRHVTIGGSGFGVMALIVAVERGWVTRDAALERLGRMLDVLTRAPLLSRRLPALHERRAPARPFRSAARTTAADIVETSLLVHGPAVRAPVLRARHAARSRDPRPHHAALGRGRVELVHAGRPRGALLALEPEQRLGDGSRDPRLERVPHHLCARRVFAALRDRAGGLSPRLRARAAAFATASPSTASSCRSACPTAARCSSRTTRSAASIRAA